jgi:hypothetical protein
MPRNPNNVCTLLRSTQAPFDKSVSRAGIREVREPETQRCPKQGQGHNFKAIGLLSERGQRVAKDLN